MIKRIIILLVLAAIGGGVYWAVWQRQAQKQTGPLSLFGNVEIRDSNLAFNNQQKVERVLVDEGDHVKAGQLLAVLDKSRLQAQVVANEGALKAQEEIVRRLKNGSRPEEIEQARANLRLSEARLVNAKATLERTEKSIASRAVSQKDLDDARGAADSAAAEVDSAKATLRLAELGPREEDIAQAAAVVGQLRGQLELSQRQLADTDLYAPADGVIRTRVIEPGEMTSPNQTAFTMALTDPKWVRAYVSEPDLGKVKPGMAAQVFSDTYPGRAYDGWVGFISPQAEFTPKTVQTEELRTALVYAVRVWVHDANDELRLGMPVTVRLVEGAATRPTTMASGASR